MATRWAFSGLQRAPQRPSAGPSVAIRGTQWLIRGTPRYSEALRGHQRPIRGHQRPLRGTQRLIRGPSARGVQRPWPCIPPKHPVPHIRPTHVVAHQARLVAAANHAQYGHTPLHRATMYDSSVAVVQALLAANPEAASATDDVRRPPSPCRVHKRPSAVIRGPHR